MLDMFCGDRGTPVLLTQLDTAYDVGGTENALYIVMRTKGVLSQGNECEITRRIARGQSHKLDQA